MSDIAGVASPHTSDTALAAVHRPNVAVLISGPDPTDAALCAAAAAADARRGCVHIIRCVPLEHVAPRDLRVEASRRARVQLHRVAARCAQLHPEVPVLEQLHVGTAVTSLQPDVGLIVTADHALRPIGHIMRPTP